MHSWHSENIMHGDLIFLVQNMSTKDEIVLNQVVMFCFYLWFLFLFPDLFVWLRTQRSFCTSDFTIVGVHGSISQKVVNLRLIVSVVVSVISKLLIGWNSHLRLILYRLTTFCEIDHILLTTRYAWNVYLLHFETSLQV
jgi:hypothetical protein